MNEKNMTALISCFSRGYHYKNNEYRIFSDNIADKIMSDEEYASVCENMAGGIRFFNPDFTGTKEAALRWIVDNQLSPPVLGRSAFCEKALYNAVRIGCNQYLIFASGYDTFAYRNSINSLKVFEIDRSEMIDDKIRRIRQSKLDCSKASFIRCDFTDFDWINSIVNSTYEQSQISFCSLLGISYYLTKQEFEGMIVCISDIVCSGSSIVFDYPTYDESRHSEINERLAKEADEDMKSKYSYSEIEKMLSDNGFLIYEHLDYEEMTNMHFSEYNKHNPDNKITAPKGVCYCLAVKSVMNV